MSYNCPPRCIQLSQLSNGSRGWGNYFQMSYYFIFVVLYCGQTLCNVLPMDACHLLLGRPWLYDNHVIHDGYANTYPLKYKRYSVTLGQLPSLKIDKIKSWNESEKSLCMSEIWVERAISHYKKIDFFVVSKFSIICPKFAINSLLWHFQTLPYGYHRYLVTIAFCCKFIVGTKCFEANLDKS